jgi:hypothetical protein
MRTVIHIGPSKTASTSLQAVIPQLGRPYTIKPSWVKHLCNPRYLLTGSVVAKAKGHIYSDEVLGDFEHISPQLLSDRLMDFFGPSIIIYVNRDSKDRLDSYYKIQQDFYARLKEEVAAKGWQSPSELTMERFLASQQRLYETMGVGFFAASNIVGLRHAFQRHDFRIINYALVKTDPNAFLNAFCEACEAPVPDMKLPWMSKRIERRIVWD